MDLRTIPIKYRKRWYFLSFFSLLFSTLTFTAFADAADNTKVTTDTTTLYINDKGMTLDSLYSIVFYSNLNYNKKKDIIFDCQQLDLFNEREKQTAILNYMLAKAKRQNNEEEIATWYCELLEQSAVWDNIESTRHYLDTLSIYADKIKSPNLQGRYYFDKGTYFIMKGNIEKGYEFFYQAIPYSEKAGNYNRINSILLQIAEDACNRMDTLSLRIASDKLQALQSANPNNLQIKRATIYTKELLFENYLDMEDSSYLDSVIYYTEQCILLSEQDPFLSKNDLINLYQKYAIYLSMKKDPGWEKIVESILAKTRNMIGDGTTSIQYILQLIREGNLFIQTHRFSEAKQRLSQIAEVINNYRGSNNISIHLDAYIFYCSYYEAIGNYKMALQYMDSAYVCNSQLYDAKAKTMLTKYDFEKQETEKEQLEKDLETEKYLGQLKSWLIITAFALALTLAFLFFFYRKRASAEKRKVEAEKEKTIAELQLKEEQTAKLLAENYLHAEQTAKKELELQFQKEKAEKLRIDLQLKEEQASNAELEKYSILSENEFKDLEISNKNEELETLQHARAELENQIEQYKKQVKKYESKNQDSFEIKTLCSTIKQNIKILIEKRSSSKWREKSPDSYLAQLDTINEVYISQLRQRYNGYLSPQNLMYCVCFSLKMDVADVADLFHLEYDSVYKIRSRLRKAFKLKGDLDIFLQQNYNV